MLCIVANIVNIHILKRESVNTLCVGRYGNLPCILKMLLIILKSRTKRSALPEVLRMSDRIIVMCEGRKTGELDIAEATQENIMQLATMREEN